MRTHLPKAFLLILVALTLWGCASFDGVILPLHEARLFGELHAEHWLGPRGSKRERDMEKQRGTSLPSRDLF